MISGVLLYNISRDFFLSLSQPSIRSTICQQQKAKLFIRNFCFALFSFLRYTLELQNCYEELNACRWVLLLLLAIFAAANPNNPLKHPTNERL